MPSFMYLMVAGLIGVLHGLIAGYFIRKFLGARAIESAEAQAARTLEDAKIKTRELVLQAKDKALKIIEGAKAEEEQRRQELKEKEARLDTRAARFDQKILDLETRQKAIDSAKANIENVKKELLALRDEQIAKLETIAGLSQEDAKATLLAHIEKNAAEDLTARLRKLEATSQDELERRAQSMLTTVIQRCAASHAVDVTTTTVDIPSDEMKGRIIGKEGRNIKALELLTGVEIIVDDTPNMITVSGFSSIRRQVAKRAIEKLVLDGRIHPARIESVVLEAKKDLTLDIKKAGEDALFNLGITGIDPKLILILGRLKYRTSFGQNVLQHSVEVAHLARLLAEELGQDPVAAKKGGLFHDIGKAVDHEVQGTHTELGYAILKKFNVAEAAAYPALTHHDDLPGSLIAQIVKAADAISAARPGARKDTLEQYIQRLSEIEKVANDFSGVEKSYAIQAGREVRVFVTPEDIDDLGAHQLARDIAKKIESELAYPGEIKVVVIRETRAIEYAR